MSRSLARSDDANNVVGQLREHGVENTRLFRYADQHQTFRMDLVLQQQACWICETSDASRNEMPCFRFKRLPGFTVGGWSTLHTDREVRSMARAPSLLRETQFQGFDHRTSVVGGQGMYRLMDCGSGGSIGLSARTSISAEDAKEVARWTPCCTPAVDYIPCFRFDARLRDRAQRE